MTVLGLLASTCIYSMLLIDPPNLTAVNRSRVIGSSKKEWPLHVRSFAVSELIFERAEGQQNRAI